MNFIGKEKAAHNFQKFGEGTRNWAIIVKLLDNLRKKKWIFRFTEGKQELKTTNSYIRYEQMRLQLNALVKMVHLEPYVSRTFYPRIFNTWISENCSTLYGIICVSIDIHHGEISLLRCGTKTLRPQEKSNPWTKRVSFNLSLSLQNTYSFIRIKVKNWITKLKKALIKYFHERVNSLHNLFTMPAPLPQIRHSLRLKDALICCLNHKSLFPCKINVASFDSLALSCVWILFSTQ